jgi:hypothetical protein
MIRHGDPGDPDLPEDPALPSSKHGSNYRPAYPIPPVRNSIDPKIAARIGAIGEAPNPANNQYLALESYKYLVPNTEVTLPRGFCAACVPSDVGPAETWTGAALAELVEGLGGAIVSPHSQSTTMVFHMVRLLKEHGKLHLLKGIIIPEGAGTNMAPAGLVASDFDTVPFLIINGDYRADASRNTNRAFVAAINASPTRTAPPATYLDLENAGKKLNKGTTHMNMLGTNSLDLFDYFLEWADANIPNPKHKGGCADGDDDRDRDDDDDDDHGHKKR